MANAKVCDRCGRFYKLPETFLMTNRSFSVIKPRDSEHRWGDLSDMVGLDICEECQKGLDEYMQNADTVVMKRSKIDCDMESEMKIENGTTTLTVKKRKKPGKNV